MLSEEKNRILTEVGPGKPMGEYLRRYWHPIAGVSEFDELTIKPIKILGEDLVLYRDLSGTFGLIHRRCPHRSADLSYGFVEQTGIRCSYHGWHYDETGNCISRPFEDTIGRGTGQGKPICTKAYVVQEKAGLIWAYMGAAPAPLLPDWDLFSVKNGFAQAVFSVVPCNWFQCQENSIDPVHFEWTHNNWTARQLGSSDYSEPHIKLEFEEFEYGFVYKRLRGSETLKSPMWSVGRVTLWPNGFYLGTHFEWRVPIDDFNTLSINWVMSKVPSEREPYVQQRIPSWYGPVKDPVTGRWITSHVANQDFVAWVGQGVVADRAHENLAASDKGVVMMRRRFFEEIESLQANPHHEPKGLIRDPAVNQSVYLPSACREEMIHGLTYEELARHPLMGPYLTDYIGQAGQPDSVRLEYERAIGAKLRGEVLFQVHSGREYTDDRLSR